MLNPRNGNEEEENRGVQCAVCSYPQREGRREGAWRAGSTHNLSYWTVVYIIHDGKVKVVV